MMHLEYENTPKLVRAATRLQINWPRLVLIFVLYGAVAAFLCDLGVHPFPNSTLSAALYAAHYALMGVAIAPLALLVLWGMIVLRAFFTFYGNPSQRGPVEFTASDQGVEAKTPRTAATYVWADFRGYRESKSVLRLYLGRTASVIVPKYGSPPGAIAELQKLAGEKLKRLR